MGTELEWKLRVADAKTLERILVWEGLRDLHPEPLRVIQMRTTYYDTADGTFRARRWTLRRRLENNRSVITLKIPLQGKLRGEYETMADSFGAALPALMAQGAPEELPQLLSGGVRTVCTAVFTRRAQLLTFPDGSKCELALDYGALCGKTERLPLCELELELKQGAPEQTEQLCAKLQSTFGLSVEERSKYARARALN